MKKALDILLLIGIILGFCSALTYTVLTIFFLVEASPSSLDAIEQAISDGTIVVNINGTVAEKAAFVQATALALCLVFFFEILVAIASVVITFIARNNKKLGLDIACIALGAVSGNPCLVVGSIFALVLLVKERNDEPNLIEEAKE